MVRRYRIQPERHTVAIHNLEGGSWRNAAGVPTCSALTDEGERSPFLHASCEKYPTVERIDSRGQYFRKALLSNWAKRPRNWQIAHDRANLDDF